MLGFAREKVPVKETTTPTQAPPGFATLHGGRSSKPIPFHAAVGEKRHVLPAETASCRGSSARQSDKSSWVEKVRAEQALPRAQPAEGKEAAVPRCRAGKMVQELLRPPGTRRGMPRYPVCHMVLFGFCFFPTCLVDKQTRGWKYRGEGQHRHRGTSRSLCLCRHLTWVMPGGGPRSFWLLGRGGADDIPKAVV